LLIVMFASRTVWIAIVALVFALACSSSSAPRAGFGSGLPRVPATPAIEKQERAMFLRLNRDREERGLPALDYDTRLADVARFHSSDMREHRFFAHDSPRSGSLDDRLNAAGYLFLTARENLSEAPDVQSGQDALLESPGHYANIVASDITHVGVGIVQGGIEARENLVMTQVFARPGRAETPEEARDALVRRIQAERTRRGLRRAERDAVLEELAALHIAELDAETSPSSLQNVGERIAKAISARKTDLRGVGVGAQLVPDSEGFQMPETLLSSANARFGVAVRKVPSAAGRPMIQLLLLVAK